MKLEITKVEPSGRSLHRGFGHLADGTPIYEWEDDDYPDPIEGKALRRERVVLGLGLRAAASLLGLTVVELSGLERGRYRCDLEQALCLWRDACSKPR